MDYYFGTLLIIVPIIAATVIATVLTRISPIRKAVTRWIEG